MNRPTSYVGTTSEYVEDKTVISYVTGSQFRGERINTSACYYKLLSRITGKRDETLRKISTNPKTKGYGVDIQVKSGKSAYDKPMIVVQFEDEYTGIDTAKLEAAIKRCKVYNDKLSRYTEKTANAYRIALDNAERYLASLFDDDGTPTAENVKPIKARRMVMLTHWTRQPQNLPRRWTDTETYRWHWTRSRRSASWQTRQSAIRR